MRRRVNFFALGQADAGAPPGQVTFTEGGGYTRADCANSGGVQYFSGKYCCFPGLKENTFRCATINDAVATTSSPNIVRPPSVQQPVVIQPQVQQPQQTPLPSLTVPGYVQPPQNQIPQQQPIPEAPSHATGIVVALGVAALIVGGAYVIKNRMAKKSTPEEPELDFETAPTIVTPPPVFTS